jgi:tetratricopeptide (TPR) repeat protein
MEVKLLNRDDINLLTRGSRQEKPNSFAMRTSPTCAEASDGWRVAIRAGSIRRIFRRDILAFMGDAFASPNLTLVLAPDEAIARAEASAVTSRLCEREPATSVIEAPPAVTWPFRLPLVEALPAGPVLVVASGLHEAFVNHQLGATRLVTSQAQYLMQEWASALAAHGRAAFIGTADLESIRRSASEVLSNRGVFRLANVRTVEAGAEPPEAARNVTGALDDQTDRLVRAFRAQDSAERLSLCVQALAYRRSAPALVATASACMEVNDLNSAARDLDEAIERAPAWAAAHFERGKAWLRADEMARASACFRAAADLLASFGPAWANLGAALGELDRTEEALAAFERALAADPESAQALNNVGVAARELGRLVDSEASFRQVIALAPDLAFGYYNLGHTLFLQGRYHPALAAYESGLTRDPGRNAVQRSRLALCQLATGDAPGALKLLQEAASGLTPNARRTLLEETSAVLWALVSQKPGLKGFADVNAWLQRELAQGS